MTHSLGVRFGLAVFFLVWVPLLTVTGWGAYWLWVQADARPPAALQSLALRGDALKLTEAASGLAEAIDRYMLDRIVEVQTWATSPVVVDAVRTARAAHAKQKLDDLSIRQVEGKFRTRKSLGLAPEAREYLSEQVRASPDFAEVFFTDEMGFNVALTNPTSDFVQSDEDWWQQAWSGGFSVGEIAFDASANVWSVDLSVRIHDDRTGNAIGVMKAVLPVRFVQLFADRVDRRFDAPGQLMHAQLFGAGLDGRPPSQFLVVTRNGLLIAETRSAHARGRIMQPEISLLTDESLQHLSLVYEGARSGAFIAHRDDGHESANETGHGHDPVQEHSFLVAFSRSASTAFYAPVIENFSGFDWMIIVEAPNLSGHTVLPELSGVRMQWEDQQAWSQELLYPVVALFASMLLASIILCWLFGRWVLVPVRALTNRVQRMERGHITGRIELSSRGELAELATALDRIRNMITKMAESLQRTAPGRTQPRTPEGDPTRRTGPDGT